MTPIFFDNEYFKWEEKKVVEYFEQNHTKLIYCMRFINLKNLRSVYDEFFGDYKQLGNRQNLENALSNWYFYKKKESGSLSGGNGGNVQSVGMILCGIQVPIYVMNIVMQFLTTDYNLLCNFGCCCKLASQLVFSNWSNLKLYSSNLWSIPKNVLCGAREIRICEKLSATELRDLWKDVGKGNRLKRLVLTDHLTLHGMKLCLKTLSEWTKVQITKCLSILEQLNFNYSKQSSKRGSNFSWGFKLSEAMPNLKVVENPPDFDILVGLKHVTRLHLKTLDKTDMSSTYSIQKLNQCQWKVTDLSLETIRGQVDVNYLKRCFPIFPKLKKLRVVGCDISSINLPNSVQVLILQDVKRVPYSLKNVKTIVSDTFPSNYDNLTSWNYSSLENVTLNYDKNVVNARKFVKSAFKTSSLQEIALSTSNYRNKSRDRFPEVVFKLNKRSKTLELCLVSENYVAQDSWSHRDDVKWIDCFDDNAISRDGKNLISFIKFLCSTAKKSCYLSSVILNDNIFGNVIITALISEGFRQVPSSLKIISVKKRPRREGMRFAYDDKKNTWWNYSYFQEQVSLTISKMMLEKKTQIFSLDELRGGTRSWK